MQSKGQIQIVFLLLIVVGVILLFTGLPDFGLDLGKKAPKYLPKKETTISAPEGQKEGGETEEEILSPSSPAVSDTTPPSRSNPQPSGDLPAQTRKIDIGLETDEQAICRYADSSGVYYEYMQHTFSNTDATSHSTAITTLSEGKEYNYYVRCVDERGNKNTDDFIIFFKVKAPEDTTPPVRRNQYPVGDILPVGTTETIIGISTNEPAYCRYAIEQGKDYNSMSKSLSDDGTKQYHTTRITGLENGKAYSYFVRCKDEAGNKNTGDVMINFEVGL